MDIMLFSKQIHYIQLPLVRFSRRAMETQMGPFLKKKMAQMHRVKKCLGKFVLFLFRGI